jgi:hypothetical protein
VRIPFLKEQTHNGTCPGGWFFGNYSLGLERTTILVGGEKYLGRWILYVAGFTLRLHRFFRGDDARAPHNHPWPFWTIPLCAGYEEMVDVADGGDWRWRWVPGWRINYRPSGHRHFVLDPREPFYTIVVTGRKERSWGFWPDSKTFIPWRQWNARK